MMDDSEVAALRLAGTTAVPKGYRVGRWVIEQTIATGAWSSVYAARPLDGRHCAEVAIKLLPVDRLSPQQASNLRELARREVACLGALQHPALVAVEESLVVDDPAHPEIDGAVVLVMERAAGNLRDALVAADGKPLPGGHELLRQLVTALVAVHGAGWVHGDVKPANVLLMDDGSVRLADFGLAGELEGTHAYLPVLGSEDYLPPEWWTEEVGMEGIPARPSRDMWAFGIVAHQVLTGGRHPFPGASARARSSAARGYARGEAALRLDAAVPDGWGPIIRDCLAPTHESRASHTAAAVLQRVESLDPLSSSPRRRRRSRPRRLALAGALLVAGVGAAVATALLPIDDGGSSSTASTVAFSGGELRDDASVPTEYREMINDAAHGCAKPEVTPALIAAMLKAESDFDPAERSPETDEYGIALWTPSVFEQWQVDADGGGPSVFSAADSIAALGKFLCTVGERNAHIPGDKALVLAAVYRGGGDNVRAVRDPAADSALHRRGGGVHRRVRRAGQRLRQMDAVIIQYEQPSTRRHDVYTLEPGESATFGRGAPNQTVVVAIDHPGMPRLAGRVTATEDYWLLSNFSRDRTLVVEDPEGGGAHVKVAPRRLGAPIPFELSKIIVPVDDGAAELVVFAPQHRFAEGDPTTTPDGETTTAAFALDETSKYFLVLLALCEPRLRDGAAVTVPSDKDIVARLRPLPGCSRISRSAVNFHLDYLARVKLRLRGATADDGIRAEWRRSALASFAVRFDLVRDEHLALLTPPRPAG